MDKVDAFCSRCGKAIRWSPLTAIFCTSCRLLGELEASFDFSEVTDDEASAAANRPAAMI